MFKRIVSIIFLLAAASVAWAQATPPSAPVRINPAISDEQLARLVIRAKKENPTTIDAKLGKLFGLTDGSAPLPVKQIGARVNGVEHYFMIALKNGVETDDYIFATRTPNVDIVTFYTDKSAALRSAARTTPVDVSALPNDQAADRYKDELTVMATLAEKLPPTSGATVTSPKPK